MKRSETSEILETSEVSNKLSYLSIMYLYNISVIVEERSHEALLGWIKKEWLPKVQPDVKFLKMLHSPHEGHTYCMQLVMENEQDIQAFHTNYLDILQQYITTRHTDKAFLFDSIMEYLE